MFRLRLLLAHILCLIIIFNDVDAQKRLKDRMYDPLKAISVCFRRMNGTAQIGCSSNRPGSTGVVHYISSKDDLQMVVQTGTAGSYIAVLPITLLQSLTPLLQASEQISGVVVHRVNDSEALAPMSHEDTCPNRGYNAPQTCETRWNKYGTGLLHFDYRFPLIYLDEDDDIEKIKNCFVKFNNFSLELQRDRSLCALELNAFMYAAVDTPTCLRRSNSAVNLNPVKFCDPLGDQSIWGSIFPLANNSEVQISPDIKYIVIAARLDSTSMFNEIYSGAVNPVTGLVTLLYTAKLLKTMLPIYDNYRKNIVFLLLNGETYDYMGSQRVLYDMEHENFPENKDKLNKIRPDDISLFIELNQLNLKTNNGKSELHIHLPRESDAAREFISALTLSLPPTLSHTEHTPSFPPSSLQTFISTNSSVHSMTGLILTDHGPDSFTNRYYNAIYDDAERLDYHYLNLSDDEGDIFVVDKHSIQQRVVDLAEAISGAVYKEVTGVTWEGERGAADDGVALVDELFHCYLETANCKIHRAIQKKKLKDEPLSFYVGVTVAPNLLTNLIGLTLAWFTGDVIKTPTGFCQKNMTSDVFKFFNMSTNIQNLSDTSCFKTSMGFTEAVSPAFLIDDYDWKSGKYSSWTESTWREFSARLFLKPSPAHESMTMAIGSVTLVLSILLVYFIQSRAHILFAPPIEVSPTSC